MFAQSDTVANFAPFLRAEARISSLHGLACMRRCINAHDLGLGLGLPRRGVPVCDIALPCIGVDAHIVYLQATQQDSLNKRLCLASKRLGASTQGQS